MDNSKITAKEFIKQTCFVQNIKPDFLKDIADVMEGFATLQTEPLLKRIEKKEADIKRLELLLNKGLSSVDQAKRIEELEDEINKVKNWSDKQNIFIDKLSQQIESLKFKHNTTLKDWSEQETNFESQLSALTVKADLLAEALEDINLQIDNLNNRRGFGTTLMMQPQELMAIHKSQKKSLEALTNYKK